MQNINKYYRETPFIEPTTPKSCTGVLPFRTDLDDADYVYRFQHRASLRHMRDSLGEYLAPSRWDPANHCPHKHYVELASTLPEERAIYTLSVWRNEATAWREWPRSEKIEDRVLLRVPRSIFSNCGLRCIDDDYLPDKAFLLYQVGPCKDGQVYGDARIPWSSILQTDASWRTIQVDDEDLRAVGDPFSNNYSGGEIPSQNLDLDFGLPADERILRKHLRCLGRLQAELSSLQRWKVLRRYTKRAELRAMQALWFNLDHSEPRIRAATRRIASVLPRDHPLYQYLNASGKLVI